MTEPRSVLARTCRALNEHGVRYLVVGDRAAQLAGHPRATLDIECLLAPELGNLERTLDALASLGLIPGGRWLAPELLRRAVTVLGREPAISLITQAGPGWFDALLAGSAEVVLEGVRIRSRRDWVS